VLNFFEDNIQFEILDVLEFTSDRKKMSVVVKNCQTGEIMLLVKGADETILPSSVSGTFVFPFSNVHLPCAYCYTKNEREKKICLYNVFSNVHLPFFLI
jgi:magnesium-transporting ATPase (P-type)